MNAAEGSTGLVVIDKEPGWTSHDVVAQVRRIFGQRRVGHAGTLDPDATGLLLVGLGRATRLLRYLTALPKTYTGEVVLGTATDTLDASGTVLLQWDMSGVTQADAARAALDLTGDIEQVPPMVSAVKIGGQPLHKLARQGIEVERHARPVRVHRFDVGPAVAPGVFPVEVECSSGTYIRVLAADLGTALGGGGHLRNLCRTQVGSFTLAESRRLADLDRTALLEPAVALRDLSQAVADSEMAHLIARGLPLDRVSVGADGDGPFAVVDERGRLLAVYESTETDRVRPTVVLAAR